MHPLRLLSALPLAVLPSVPLQSGAPSINFMGIGIAIGGISLGLIGVIMAGSALFPEVADRYKRMIPNVLIGLLLISISSFLVSAFAAGAGGG